jgi:hypothetical protein
VSSQTKTDQITVRLKRGGWEIEITCSEEKLKQAIDSVLSSLSSTSANPNVTAESGVSEASKKTCRGLIVDLWQEGWFSQGRSLSQVDQEIERRGYHYDRTAVSHALTDLVRENILTRDGPPRNYVYVQKKPPTVVTQSIQKRTTTSQGNESKRTSMELKTEQGEADAF